jgi:hypothetical protein
MMGAELNTAHGDPSGAPEERSRPAAEPVAWTQTPGGAWESGEYLVTERIDGKGWNATLGGITLLLAAPLEECKAACVKFAAEDFPLEALIAAKEALFAGGAEDPELADGRRVLEALEARGMLTPRARTELASIQRGDETLPFPVHIARWPREEGGPPDAVAHVLSLAAQPWILASVAHALAKGGVEFPAKTEAELAVALHYLLVHALRDPINGLDQATAALKGMRGDTVSIADPNIPAPKEGES